MNNKQGFTLVEILLAVMIVGVIGVALAALTTAAVRDSGVGRTKIVLRNQLSQLMRQLREDIHNADTIQISGDGNTITLTNEHPAGPGSEPDEIEYIFEQGSTDALPKGAGYESKTGGTITRTADGTSEVVLSNVKSIPGYLADDVQVPEFSLQYEDQGKSPILRVRIIVEVPSTPVVNEAIEETFILPNGFAVVSNG